MGRLRFLIPLLLAGVVAGFPLVARGELVVVVNVRSGVAAMTRNEVVNIFFGRSRQFFNGLEAQPVDLAESHPDRARFYQALVGKETSQVDAYWSRQLFTGKTRPPPRVATSDEVVRWVIANPGGIGFVDAARADARVRVVYELSH